MKRFLVLGRCHPGQVLGRCPTAGREVKDLQGHGCSLANAELAVPEQAVSAGEVYSKGKNKLLIMRAAPAGLSGPHGLMNIQHRAEH